MARRMKGEGSLRQRADGRWEARLTVDGKAWSCTGKDKDTVFEEWESAKKAARKGLPVENNKMKLNEWIERWLKVYKKRTLKDKSYGDYVAMYTIYIKPNFEKIFLTKLRGDSIQEWINKLHDEGYSSATIKLAYAVLRGAVDKAYKLDMIYTLPTKSVEMPKSEKKAVINIMTAKQQKVFIEACKAHEYGNIYRLMLFTGMRPGEALGLKWKYVNLPKKTITICESTIRYAEIGDNFEIKSTTKHQESTKSATSNRTIQMSDAAFNLLTEMQAKRKNLHDVCVGSDGQVPSGDVLRTKLKEILSEAKIPAFTPHKLRHTFATRCFEKGMQVKMVQEMLGHSTFAMTTDIYTHVLEEQTKKEMALLNKAFND